MEDFDCDDVAALDPLDENAVVKFIGGRYRAAPEGRPAKHHLIYTRAGPVVVAVNPLQTEAIRSDNSAVLVLASPGTGKTRVLRARMAYLLISKGVPSDRILTVAFSQHAVSQLRTRVGALTDTKGMWLGTFHSICARIFAIVASATSGGFARRGSRSRSAAAS